MPWKKKRPTAHILTLRMNLFSFCSSAILSQPPRSRLNGSLSSLIHPLLLNIQQATGKKQIPQCHTHTVFSEILEGNGGQPSPSCIRNNYVECNLDMGICLLSRVEEKMDLSGRGWCIITAVHKTHVERDSFRHAWVYKETWWYRGLPFYNMKFPIVMDFY